MYKNNLMFQIKRTTTSNNKNQIPKHALKYLMQVNFKFHIKYYNYVLEFVIINSFILFFTKGFVYELS